MSRNPKWARDEVILALDLFFRLNPLHNSETHPEILHLSHLLNQLPIHARDGTDDKFRNPNGVYMKLCNFLSFDPSYKGKGLSAGSKLDKAVWEEFSDERIKLSEVANAIRNNSQYLAPPKTKEEEASQEDEEFPEGRVLARTHMVRERNSTLTKKKKKQALDSTGRLKCEVCSFDYFDEYGEIGEGYAECHHNKPVSKLIAGEKSKLSDLSLVCASCHRMLHRSRPWLTVSQLAQIVAEKRSAQK